MVDDGLTILPGPLTALFHLSLDQYSTIYCIIQFYSHLCRFFVLLITDKRLVEVFIRETPRLHSHIAEICQSLVLFSWSLLWQRSAFSGFRLVMSNIAILSMTASSLRYIYSPRSPTLTHSLCQHSIRGGVWGVLYLHSPMTFLSMYTICHNLPLTIIHLSCYCNGQTSLVRWFRGWIGMYDHYLRGVWNSTKCSTVR